MIDALRLAVVSLAVALAAVPSDPQALMTRALTAIHQQQTAPFLRYRMRITLTHKGRNRTYSYDVLERLVDHYARFTSLNADGTPSTDIHLHTTLVSPAYFLNVVSEDANAVDSSLRTIGSVISIPYSAAMVPNTATFATDCVTAMHLALTPKGDGERHPLRDLWVDPHTDRICAAGVAKNIAIISRERVLVNVALDDRGYVTAWTLQGKGHTLFGTYSLGADAAFSSIEPVSHADDKLFR